MSLAIGSDELQLSEQEAHAYAEAVAAVARHYDVAASAKSLDWMNLIGTAGSIYGARAMILYNKRKIQQSGAAPMANGYDPAAHADLSSMAPRATA